MSSFKSNQRGSVIIWILIAIGLFAALGYAFSKSSSNSISMLEDEQLEAYANQFIAYGNDVRQAVKRLELKGCDPSEISFDNNVDSTNYVNTTPSPSDKSCHVFEPNGGGLTWQTLPTKIQLGSSSYGKYRFTGALGVQDVGTDQGDLALWFAMYQTNSTAQKFCTIYNEKFSIDYDNTSSDNLNMANLSPFRGNYPSPAVSAAIVGDNNALFARKKNACFREGHGGGSLVVYQVLKVN